MRGDVLEEVVAAAEAFVVSGSLGDVGEPGAEVCSGVADEPGFGVVSEEGLQHSEGGQLGVGQFRGDAYLGPGRRPVGVFGYEVVDGCVECSREGVQIRVHSRPPRSGVFHPGSWTLPPPICGISPPHPLELLI